MALQSLQLAIFRYSPRPVLPFYDDAVPAAEYAPEELERVAPPEFHNLIEVSQRNRLWEAHGLDKGCGCMSGEGFDASILAAAASCPWSVSMSAV